MGLAGPKTRSKISTDPNNTTWSRSTSRFGHRILTSQGWTPGQALNPHAGHAGHYTVANTSHIRIALKDDNLGLGATRGGRDAETFGLSQLAGLLGRLNGKGEGELRKEEAARRNMQLVGYQERRWGAVRFVSGGFLVGEKVEEEKESKDEGAGTAAPVARAGEPDAASLKKRKRTDEEEPDEEETRSLKKKRSSRDLRAEAKKQESRHETPKGSQRRKHRDAEDVELTTEPATAASSSSASASLDERAERRRRKAEKKARKAAEFAESGESATAATTADVSAAVSSDEVPDKAEKRRRKAERKAAKELKRLKKEGKRLKREERRLNNKEKSRTDDATSSASSKESSPELSAGVQQAEAQAKPPARFAGGRHAVRQRYIRSKQMASMDPQALKEIFMIKAQS